MEQTKALNALEVSQNSNIRLFQYTDPFLAFPRTNEIRLLTPRRRRSHHTSYLRTKYLRLRRAAVGSSNPSPLLLRRIQLPPNAPQNLQLWHLHRLQGHRRPPRAQRSTNTQAAPALFPLPSQEARRSHLCKSSEISWSRNSQRA
jgi:hypothetical protein